jgi:hypothetical protein
MEAGNFFCLTYQGRPFHPNYFLFCSIDLRLLYFHSLHQLLFVIILFLYICCLHMQPWRHSYECQDQFKVIYFNNSGCANLGSGLRLLGFFSNHRILHYECALLLHYVVTLTVFQLDNFFHPTWSIVVTSTI